MLPAEAAAFFHQVRIAGNQATHDHSFTRDMSQIAMPSGHTELKASTYSDLMPSRWCRLGMSRWNPQLVATASWPGSRLNFKMRLPCCWYVAGIMCELALVTLAGEEPVPGEGAHDPR